MTNRAWVFWTASIVGIAFVGGWLALHYVPSPFASVALRGDTVVAQIRPNTRFGMVPQRTRVGESISGSASIEFRDGESVRLGSPRTGYTITCRISPKPAGLYIQGFWTYHDFPRSALKTWFAEAH